MRGLSLFTGIAGIDIALQEWITPIAYCEIERYCQAVLLSRMRDGTIPRAPIFKDVTKIKNVGGKIDIIYGGFPCQDISVAGNGKGLEGERSGLFFEIMRLTDILQPKFIFLENVPGIVVRGLDRVTAEITKRGYDCRWTHISAREMGALHKRDRWFLLAYNNMQRCVNNTSKTSRKNDSLGWKKSVESVWNGGDSNAREELPKNKAAITNNGSKRIQGQRLRQIQRLPDFSWCEDVRRIENLQGRSDIPQPLVRGKSNGLQYRAHRIKSLGNAVVPIQAKEAFKRLMGL